jgi:hypothetical protein
MLTDTSIRNAKATGKPYKLHDSAGLYVLVSAKGDRYFRYDYRFVGKRRKISFLIGSQALWVLTL